MFTPNFAGRRSQGRGFGRIQAEGNDVQDLNSPTYVVRSIASDRDDYYMLALTFRSWVIGSIICGLNGFFKARALFEKDSFDISPVLVQFLSPFLGWLMAAALPKKVIRVPCTGGFTFSLNPGDPLSTPRSTIFNLMGGLLLLLNVVTPIINWTNAYETKRIPLSSSEMHDSLGHIYNVSRVRSADGITLDEKAYEDYSRVYFSALTVASNCFKVGSISAGLIGSFLGLGPKTNLITLSILLLSCIVALVLVPPLGIFVATTGHVIPVELASKLLGGYIYPSTPFQGMIFDSFANQITINTVSILGTMKLGHYVKIDPKTTYTVVVAAMIIGASVSFGETWYRTYPGKNSCSKDKLPTGSCPWLDVFYNTTYMWAFLGSDRILNEGNYDVLGLWFIVVSAVAQVLLLILSRKWKFLQYINLPIILAVSSGMPPAMAAYMNSWLAVGIIFPFVAYKYFNNWTPANQFLLSVAISVGTGFTNSLLFASKGHINPPKWWGSKMDDHCPLAKKCASAPRIRVPGCP
ncbi:hypothetical protein RHMOL_Rhmol03G0017100 [Rhododendron molle]|uniref:Uncharacterized protein n=1 Tax=Rhododendron molle TaxID=49168 RepID=A0ACC0PBW4_RHOML|nr:hypothetical protein RHMOL_Rhmol03G0017100 [Rhododendron molle]